MSEGEGISNLKDQLKVDLFDELNTNTRYKRDITGYLIVAM